MATQRRRCDPRNYTKMRRATLRSSECSAMWPNPSPSSYLGEIDIFDDDVTTEFWDNRFAHDLHVAVSRDDGATWKRMNVSRMADLSSFDLETGEPFPGTVRSPQMKVNDNHILAVWTSTYARGGNPCYAINLCDDPDTPEAETPETGCADYCRGDAEQGTESASPTTRMTTHTLSMTSGACAVSKARSTMTRWTTSPTSAWARSRTARCGRPAASIRPGGPRQRALRLHDAGWTIPIRKKTRARRWG